MIDVGYFILGIVLNNIEMCVEEYVLKIGKFCWFLFKWLKLFLGVVIFRLFFLFLMFFYFESLKIDW